MYFRERGLRQSLQKEGEVNAEILKACDRFASQDVKIRFPVVPSSESDVPLLDGPSCPPCTHCEKELVDFTGEDSSREPPGGQHLRLSEGAQLVQAQHAMEELTTNTEYVTEKNERMQKALQKISRELLSLKFGKPPYIVDLSVKLPNRLQQITLHLQMAPVSEMPYTVLYFLSQVAAGVWDGCSFVSNAGHIIIADTRGPHCKRNNFRKLDGVDETLAFQEYSPAFPHVKYTLGMMGR